MSSDVDPSFQDQLSANLSDFQLGDTARTDDLGGTESQARDPVPVDHGAKPPKLFQLLGLHVRLDFDNTGVRDDFRSVVSNGLKKLRESGFPTDTHWSTHSQKQKEKAVGIFRCHLEQEYKKYLFVPSPPLLIMPETTIHAQIRERMYKSI